MTRTPLNHAVPTPQVCKSLLKSRPVQHGTLGGSHMQHEQGNHDPEVERGAARSTPRYHRVWGESGEAS